MPKPKRYNVVCTACRRAFVIIGDEPVKCECGSTRATYKGTVVVTYWETKKAQEGNEPEEECSLHPGQPLADCDVCEKQVKKLEALSI